MVTFRTLRRARFERTRSEARALAVGLTGAWVYLSTHMLVDNLYVNNTHLMIGALLGLLVVISAYPAQSTHTA